MKTPLPPMYRCEICSGPKSSLDSNCWKCAKWAKETFARLISKTFQLYHNIAETP